MLMNKAHVYKRDHINTDEIMPARYLNTDNEAELAKHCLEDLDKDFVKKVKEGDIIEIVGTHPSSKKEIPMAVKALGLELIDIQEKNGVWKIKIRR